MSSDRSIHAGNPGDMNNAGRPQVSAQEEYFQYMLLKERIGGTDEGRAILASKSEKDTIKEAILAKLVHVRESTAEWSQLVDLTKSENRFVQADVLASIAWEKKKAELILAQYTPDDLGSVFAASKSKLTGLAAAGRLAGAGAAAASPAGAALARAVGL